jgi:hypothetical protein
MKLIVLLATVLVGGACVASAAPLCVSGATMASYQALGAGGCTIGNLLFSNFIYGGTSFGTASVPNTDVFLTPVDAGTFYPGPGIVFSSSGWSLPAASPTTFMFIDSTIRFNVSALPGSGVLIDDGSLALLSPVATGTGQGGVTEIISPAGIKLEVDANGLLVSQKVFAPTASVSVLKDLLIAVPQGAAGSGSVQITSFAENFSEVPEPVGTVLIGSGLLALGIWRRRASRRD